jgi:cation diffusion facilitator family transporter
LTGPRAPATDSRSPPALEARGESRGVSLARTGLVVNGCLALVKLLAGILGHSYALIADAVESVADIFSSLVVWTGLRVSSRGADRRFPFGYGKAESVSSAMVGLMLVGAALGIAIEAVREIVTPHHAPAAFTLIVLGVAVAIKEALFRRVASVAREVGSQAVAADASHHRSDAITSAAAFVGISIALIGGPGWEPADDWAALLASTIILYNGVRIIRPALAELMDQSPAEEVFRAVDGAARGVAGVLATEKLKIRKSGTRYLLELHVQAEPQLSLQEAHILSGKVKSAIRGAEPRVQDVLVHMEPFEG